MNDNEKLMIFGGLGLLAFLIYRSQGTAAAAVALNSNALAAQSSVANTNLIANSALTLGNDANQIATGFEDIF